MRIFYKKLINQLNKKKKKTNKNNRRKKNKCNDDLFLHTQADKFNPFL